MPGPVSTSNPGPRSPKRTLTCVFCGMAYPAGTPAHGSQVLVDHIRVCEKHPLREAEATIQRQQEFITWVNAEWLAEYGVTAQEAYHNCTERAQLETGGLSGS